jgi:hypothetical protein
MWVKTWGDDEKIDVSQEAQRLIGVSFKENKPKLAQVGGERTWKNGTRTLNETLVKNYLDNIRDLKTQRSGPIAEWKVRSIERSDVQEYSLKTFLSDIYPVLNGPNGELHVISDPTGASILLDKSSRGNTEKTTVERAGRHHIVVNNKKGLQCSDDIYIPDGGTLTFHCP